MDLTLFAFVQFGNIVTQAPVSSVKEFQTSGSMEDIYNSFARNGKYCAAEDMAGKDVLTIILSDGELNSTVWINITILDVDDIPRVTKPSDTWKCEEDVRCQVGPFSIIDPDFTGINMGKTLRVTLTVHAGSLNITNGCHEGWNRSNLSRITNEKYFNFSNSAVSKLRDPNVKNISGQTIELVCNLSSINQALSMLEYTGKADFYGNETLEIYVDDCGCCGKSNTTYVSNETEANRTSPSASIPFVVEPVNDRPTLAVISLEKGDASVEESFDDDCVEPWNGTSKILNISCKTDKTNGTDIEIIRGESVTFSVYVMDDVKEDDNMDVSIYYTRGSIILPRMERLNHHKHLCTYKNNSNLNSLNASVHNLCFVGTYGYINDVLSEVRYSSETSYIGGVNISIMVKDGGCCGGVGIPEQGETSIYLLVTNASVPTTGVSPKVSPGKNVTQTLQISGLTKRQIEMHKNEVEKDLADALNLSATDVEIVSITEINRRPRHNRGLDANQIEMVYRVRAKDNATAMILMNTMQTAAFIDEVTRRFERTFDVSPIYIEFSGGRKAISPSPSGGDDDFLDGSPSPSPHRDTHNTLLAWLGGGGALFCVLITIICIRRKDKKRRNNPSVGEVEMTTNPMSDKPVNDPKSKQKRNSLLV